MWKSHKHKKKYKGDDDDDEEDEERKYTTVKCGLRNIVRPKYREAIIGTIEANSIMSTKICSLASLLFLYRVQSAYDKGRLHREFFAQDGQTVIKESFHAVLAQNANTTKLEQEFWQLAEGVDDRFPFEWPRNKNFGNALKDLMKVYTTNVTTNLKTHCKKRLTEYLKLKVYQSNTATPVIAKYTPNDITNVVDYLLYKKDIERNSNVNQVKRLRRNMLIQTIQNISWFDIFEDELFECKSNWFKAMPMWIAMQREIDEYNTRRGQSQPPEERNQQKKKPRRWRPREKQMLDNPKNPPEIKNLSVIPICDFKRTHYIIDNFTLYYLLSARKILERKGTANIPFKQFMREKNEQWNKYFYMRKIRWFVRRKKEFDFRIKSDGISVSLQYISPKKEPKPTDLERVKMEIVNGTKKKLLGVDPGLNKWQAVVQRDIETGKEVSTMHTIHKINSIHQPYQSTIISFVRIFRSISRSPAKCIIGVQSK